jgi:hypothetical protein
MDNYSLEDSINLVKNGKKVEARKSLQEILKLDLHNLTGWYWYVETFDTPEEKLKALHLCLKYNPDNQIIKDAIHSNETQYPRLSSNKSNNYSSVNKQKPLGSNKKKSGKLLWIIGGIVGLCTISTVFILGIGALSRKQVLVDPISPRATTIPTKTNTPKPNTGKWQVYTSTSKFDNSTTVLLSLEANDSVDGWLTTTVPTMNVRCMEGEIDVFVNIGMPAEVEYGKTDSATVRVRLDQNQAVELIMNESTDDDALFFRDPYDVILAMLQSREMVFGFTPFNADPEVTTFDLVGLANVIGPLKKSCKWDGTYPTAVPFPTFPPLPTATSTATPLPPGSDILITGITSGNWRVSIEKILITKSVSAYGSTTKAGGQFALIFLNVTNLGNDPDLFSGFGQVQVRDSSGKFFDEDGIVSTDAAMNYNVDFGSFIQPGDTTKRIVAFDLPMSSPSYYLVPNSILAEDNGQSILLVFP